MRAGLQAVLPALLGFCALCALVGTGLERRVELRLLPGSIEAQKFREFRAHKDEYDLVYVGTSRVLRGFDPSVFDARLSALGRPLRSFNFGLVGLGFLEERRLVEWILAERPARLRWLLIDPTDIDVVMHRANLFTMRDVAWHTAAITLRALRATWQSGRPRADKLELSRVHLLHWLKRACNLGTGSAWLTPWVGGVEAAALDPAGFGGVDERERPRDPEARLQRDPNLVWPSPVLWDTLRGLPELARERGLRTRFVIPPTPRSIATFRQAEERGDLPGLIAYERDDFPQLFAEMERHFYDGGHLNRRGAGLFSQRLAAELLDWLGER